MAMLADLERLFERLFERPTARLFRTRLQPLQVERRVERAMDRSRVGQGSRTVVPARYRVRLNAGDVEDLVGDDGPDAFAARLADAALAFARAHGYHLPGRPTVSLVVDPAVDRGIVEVDAVGMPGRATATQPPQVGHAVPDVPVVPERQEAGAAPPPASPDPVLAAVATSAVVAPAAPTILEPDDDRRPGGIRGDGTETLVFRRPAPQPVHAVLRVVGRDGSERTIQVDGTPLSLGRAPDNGLVVADPRISRHHARLQTRRGTLVLTDTGSTNGSRVNGVRVDECALGTGDRVQVGDTILIVEQLPG